MGVPTKEIVFFAILLDADVGGIFQSPLRKQLTHFKMLNAAFLTQCDPLSQQCKIECKSLADLLDADQLRAGAGMPFGGIERGRYDRG